MSPIRVTPLEIVQRERPKRGRPAKVSSALVVESENKRTKPAKKPSRLTADKILTTIALRKSERIRMKK